MYGRLITMCPITTVRIERGIPAAWKSSSSEIPKTTYGITSGLEQQRRDGRLAPEAAARRARSRRARRAATAPMLEIAATIALVSQRRAQVGVGEELVVPVQREPAQRERRQLRVVEREDQQDRDRRVEEDRRRARRTPAAARRRSARARRPSAAVTCRGCRKREKTIVSTATTPSRKSASTEPVCQSGKPVPNRSTIWLPYM